MPRRSRTNVIDDTAPLVGRVADRAALAARFDGGARLVTVTGLGGVGKTRVAMRFAAERLEDYAVHGGGGVWWCDVTEARSAMAVGAGVAAALGIPLEPSTGEARVVAELGAAIARRKRILIVLDNFEHLVAQAPATLGTWMTAAPQAQFLVTSRVALGLAGEQVHPLVGLDDADAVALFLTRARQVRPDLPLPDDELGAVTEIVRRLDGLPLAIELAAARVRALVPSQIRERLDQPLALLVRTGDRGRHGSIRRTVEDSVASLDPQARAAFAGCASFRGGFTLEAAEAVVGEPGLPLWPVLETLCGHSLLRVTGAPPRFSWSEPIREVAEEALAADPPAGAVYAARHISYFARHGRALAARAEISAAPAALAALAAELENLVAAHTAALPDRGADALALALALDPLLATRGMLRLRLRLLDGALAAATAASAMSGDVVHALVARAAAARELGAFDNARADLLRAEALTAELAIPRLAGLIGARLGELIEIAGDTAAARHCFEQALVCLDGSSHDPGLDAIRAELHARLAHALRREGDLRRGRHHLELAASLYRAAGHDAGVGAMAYEAGAIALFDGDLALARRHFEASQTLARELESRTLEAANNSALGILAQAEGALDQAIVHHAAAVQAFRDLGNRHREGSALYYLAGAYLERGEPAQASILFEQSSRAIAAVGAVRYQALIAAKRALTLTAAGDAAAAETAFEAAETAAASCRSERGVAAALAIHRAQLAWTPGDDEALVRARAIAAATPGDDPQLALRMFEARVRPGARHAQAPLQVRAGGAGFCLPGAITEVALGPRSPLRRIVWALARGRIDAPGEALAAGDLLAAGWPGERINHDAANNRLHVALATLRKLGLRGVLVSGEHGYLLDPAVAVELEN